MQISRCSAFFTLFAKESQRSTRFATPQVETRTCTWHSGAHEALGMHLVRSDSSSSSLSSHALFMVRQIAPGSWAQRQGVKPGDALVSIGGSKLQSLDGLQVCCTKYDGGESELQSKSAPATSFRGFTSFRV